MPFDPSDARSKLAGSAAVKEPPTAYAGAEDLKFYETAPTVTADGGRTWYGRGQNFVLGYTELDGELEFARTGQPDEYVVLLPDRTVTADVEANGERLSVHGDTLVIVPPGDSTVRLVGAGRVI